MNIKDLFKILHSWEFPLLLKKLIEISFFDTLQEELSLNKLKDIYHFKEDKMRVLLDVLESHGLISIENDKISLSEFSKKYLLKDSKFYIGSYIVWRIEDLKHWEVNMSSVLKGKMKTVHGDYQYLEYTDKHKEALEGIVVACSKVYPAEDFARKIKDNIVINGSLLDLGCGTGFWGLALQKEFPDLNLTLFDRETDFINIKESESNFKEKISIVKGDMFESGSLPKANNVLVANVFMDWSDEVLIKMLQKIVKECNPNVLLIHEFVLEKDIPFLNEYNFFAQMETLGKIRSKDWWFTQLKVYFKNIDFVPLEFGSMAIICRQ